MQMRNIAAAASAGMVAAALLLSPVSVAAETLKFVTWQKGEKGYGDWWDRLIAEFEKSHPGVKIEFTNVPRGKFADTMTTLFASGSPPDIVHLAAFEFPLFAESDWLEDLGPRIKKSGVDLTGWAGQGKCVWEGKTDCIMLQYSGYIMGVNESILKKAGVAVPTNWEQFLAAARATTQDTDKDGIVDVYGTGIDMSASNNYANDMLNFVLDAGAYWTTPEGKAAMNTPGMVEGINRWTTLIKEGLTPQNVSSGDVRQLFIEGKLAMRVDGPWIYGAMQKADPAILKDLKLVESPFNPPVGGASNVLGIARDSSEAKKALVWEFITLAMSRRFQELYAELGASPAPMPGAVTDAVRASVPHFDLLVQSMNKAAQAGVDRLPKGLETSYTEFAKILREEMQRLVIEKSTPQAAAERLQARTEALQK